MSALLNVQEISAGYGPIHVLHQISLQVHSGEIVSIIGANGAGKTTTLMCISRIQPIRTGRIEFDSKNINALEAHELNKLGLIQVPEGRKIFPRLTVLENLELGAFARSKSESLDSEYEKVFELFPVLADRKKQAGGTLSGGEQQMLAIGRALMGKPRMLLLDEPSMGIAPLLVEKIFETIKRLNREGMTILLVEQNARLALSVATRGYVLETGKVIMQDQAQKLLKDPGVIEAYLGGA